jgi:hypothetical protein
MGMPLIWIMVDWAGFADPLYSMKRSQSFAVDIATGKNPSQGLKLSDWTAYPAFLKNAFFDTFSLSSWLSARTAVLITLSLAGIVVMYLKHPRLFLLLACPVFGSTLFYFVASLGENLFRYGYLYYNWIFVTVVVSVGLAGICGLVRHLGQRRVAGLIRVTLACLVVLFLTAGPYEQAVVGRTIPTLKKWAAFSKRAGPAIQTIANDVDRTTGDPIIVTTTQVPGNRIALQMSTGKNIFLVERLLRKEQFGQNTLLPDFEGRTVYVAAPEYVPGAVGQFLQALVMNSKSREVIYDGTGIVVLKCLY